MLYKELHNFPLDAFKYKASLTFVNWPSLQPGSDQTFSASSPDSEQWTAGSPIRRSDLPPTTQTINKSTQTIKILLQTNNN
jgi:hypothetical protein